jgi:biotin synthase
VARAWHSLADLVLDGGQISRADALSVLRAPDEELPALLEAAARVRRRFFGDQVQIHVLSNIKSGLCPEDCSFCAQSVHADAPIEKYGQVGAAALVGQARRAKEAGGRMF